MISEPGPIYHSCLIYFIRSFFSADGKCDGCGICLKVCPVRNIEMTNNIPVWLHHCENCLVCYNWCPKKAIKGGIAAKGYYYRHPDIKITETMKQRGNYLTK